MADAEFFIEYAAALLAHREAPLLDRSTRSGTPIASFEGLESSGAELGEKVDGFLRAIEGIGDEASACPARKKLHPLRRIVVGAELTPGALRAVEDELGRRVEVATGVVGAPTLVARNPYALADGADDEE
jgi:hypothetical protein